MQQNTLDKIAALPGVQSAALSSTVPMDNGGWHDLIFAEDHAYTDSKIPPLRRYRFISPGLLKTMGNSLVAGRDFTWTDVYGMRPVALVSDCLLYTSVRPPIPRASPRRARRRSHGSRWAPRRCSGRH